LQFCTNENLATLFIECCCHYDGEIKILVRGNEGLTSTGARTTIWLHWRLISDFPAISQTPAEATRPRTRDQWVYMLRLLPPSFRRYQIILTEATCMQRRRIAGWTRTNVKARPNAPTTTPSRHPYSKLQKNKRSEIGNKIFAGYKPEWAKRLLSLFGSFRPTTGTDKRKFFNVWNVNRKSYVFYHMVTFSITLSDP